MKKVLFSFGFIAALGGALLTQSFTNAPAAPTDILYKPNCDQRNCATTSGTFSCTDLTIECEGDPYTGNLRRNVF